MDRILFLLKEIFILVVVCCFCAKACICDGDCSACHAVKMRHQRESAMDAPSAKAFRECKDKHRGVVLARCYSPGYADWIQRRCMDALYHELCLGIEND